MPTTFFAKFKKNKRGYLSLLALTFLFLSTIFAEFIANDKPLLVRFNNEFYFPILKNFSEKNFGGEFETEAKAYMRQGKVEKWVLPGVDA